MNGPLPWSQSPRYQPCPPGLALRQPALPLLNPGLQGGRHTDFLKHAIEFPLARRTLWPWRSLLPAARPPRRALPKLCLGSGLPIKIYCRHLFTTSVSLSCEIRSPPQNGKKIKTCVVHLLSEK